MRTLLVAGSMVCLLSAVTVAVSAPKPPPESCGVLSASPRREKGSDAHLDTTFGTRGPGPAISLRRISTPFNSPVGIDYHQPTDTIILTVNYSSGEPHNFERVQFDGSHVPFSNIHGYTDEVYVGAVRPGNVGGFIAGDIYCGNGRDGEIVKITNGGNTIFNPWVSLPGSSNGLLRGKLFIDRTGVWGGDLIVSTTAGQIWRVRSDGTTSATPLATLSASYLEGLCTVPNDVARFGPLAGKVLTGDEGTRAMYAIDQQGQVQTYPLGIPIEDILVVPPNENFFGVDYGGSQILGAPASDFAGLVGEIVVSAESVGGSGLYHLVWTGSGVQLTSIPLAAGAAATHSWEQVTFAPAGIAELCPSVIQHAASEIAPSSGSNLPAGVPVVLSGRLAAVDQSRPIVGVLVNGEPADVTDTAGRFFKQVTLQSGNNVFDVRGVERCGESSTLVSVNGVSDQSSTGTQDSTLAVSMSYANTTYNRTGSTLLCDAVARNIGGRPLDAPIRLIVDHFAEATVAAANPDGFTTDGKPYFLFMPPAGALTLEANAVTAVKRLAFRTATGRANFSQRWESRQNQAPVFSTVPPTVAIVGRQYRYQAGGIDPDGNPISFGLEVAPAGMAVDTAGLVSWTPVAGQLGSQSVSITVTDSRGTTTTQRYSIDVRTFGQDRPPNFTSLPVVHASPGAGYEYVAHATDLDGDAIAFTKQQGPSGLVVDVSGRVHWDFALPGQHPVTIRAHDATLYSEQTFVLTVGAVSTDQHAPRLFGTPATAAAVGRLYFYQSVASDGDNDVLTFTLESGPGNASLNSATGRLNWTPTATQVGTSRFVLSVSDGHGGVARQVWDVQVLAQLANAAPVIDSIPMLGATVGTTYEYLVHAVDPENASVVYSLVASPAGMTIVPSSGGARISWTPTSPSTDTVAVKAQDPGGAFGSQVYTLTTLSLNHAPVVVSSPVTTAVVGGTYRYQFRATDEDGDRLAYSLVNAPAGMVIDGPSGLIQWTPSNTQAGPNQITVAVADPRGGTASQSLTVMVAVDNERPTVQLTWPGGGPVRMGTVTPFCVQAGDNVSVVSRSLMINGVVVQLEPTGCYQYTVTSLDTVLLQATATDGSGNVGMVSATVPVIDPGTTGSNPPSVELISPPLGTLITAPTDIVATIGGSPGQAISWRVRVARGDSGQFSDVASGSGAVTSGVIARIDPTQLPNDSYRIEIVASDGVSSRTAFFDLSVAGDLKLGNYSTTVTDLAIPVAGIPLAISRQYDSLDTSTGDFGAGWRLQLSCRVSDNASEATDETFNAATRVYVTRPDGRRVGFTFAPQSIGGLFSFFLQSQFRADPGVNDKLEALDGNEFLVRAGSDYIPFLGTSYNPRLYKFTTKEGVAYTIDEINGLQQVRDINGNTIDVTPQGLISSTGLSLLFHRDSQGRIDQITEPTDASSGRPPGVLRYQYSAAGNLVGFVDQMNHITEYRYEQGGFPHHLTKIVDPLNRPVLTNVFDPANGRLIGQCPADGNPTTLIGCSQYIFDPESTVQTVINARGNRIDYVLDSRGNTLSERRYLPDGTPVQFSYTFDARNNVLTEESPGGNIRRKTYDANDNVLTESDASGRLWQYRYDSACGNLSLVIDPAGNQMSFVYDAKCNLARMTDSLGNSWTFGYNAYGERTTETDASGNQWQYEYNDASQPVRIIDPLGSVMTFGYDVMGRLITRTDRDGRRIDFAYDAAGDIVRESWNTVPPKNILFQYDAAGRLLESRTPEVSTQLSYWPSGLLRDATTRFQSGGPVLSTSYGRFVNGQLDYGYDGSGNVTAMVDQLGVLTEYSYDTFERRASIRQQGPGTLPKRADLSFTAAGALASLIRYSDVNAIAAVATTTYQYACGGCPSSLSAIRHSQGLMNAPLMFLEYSRDALGRVSSIQDNDGVHTYEYDGIGQLLSVHHPAAAQQSDEWYEYDPVGNRQRSHLSNSYTYSYEQGRGGNQLASDDSTTYQYDRSGRVIRMVDIGSGITSEFDYDHRGRLIASRVANGAGQVLSDESFEYDAGNRRVIERNGVSQKYVLHDGQNPVAWFDGSGQVLSRVFTGRTPDSGLAVETGGQIRWLLQDQVRSTRMALDNAGTSVGEMRYDSFGNIATNTLASILNIEFDGRPRDLATNTVYLRARHYLPRLGRFLQEDPVAPYGYEFGGNDPVINGDPFGKSVLAEYQCLVDFAVARYNFMKPRIEAVGNLYDAVSKAISSLDPGDAEAAGNLADGIPEKFFPKYKEVVKLVKTSGCGGNFQVSTKYPYGSRPPPKTRFPLPDKGWTPGSPFPPYRHWPPY